MWRNVPVKGVANGEPTYEQIGKPGAPRGLVAGPRGMEQPCAGGTMGVVYGAGSLWQWRLHADEPDHQEWCRAEGAGWREALDFEGSAHVGRLGQILDGLPLADMAPNWEVTLGRRGLLSPGKLYIGYASEGGHLKLFGDEVPQNYRVVDPRTGEVVCEGTRLLVGRPMACPIPPPVSGCPT